MKRRLSPLPALVVIAMAGTPLLSAHGQAEPPKQSRDAQDAKQYSEKELKAYATAAVQVTEINRTYSSKLQAADSPEKQKEIRMEAADKMTQVIEKEGLSVEQYNEIYYAAVADAQLAEKLNDMITKAR